MSKHRRRRETEAATAPAAADQKAAAPTTPPRTGWRRFPIWAWALIFVVPLVLSEFMFYQAGRTVNMVLFPIVWAGFWAALWYRSRARSGG